jgi:hypothetical protein
LGDDLKTHPLAARFRDTLPSASRSSRVEMRVIVSRVLADTGKDVNNLSCADAQIQTAYTNRGLNYGWDFFVDL